MATGLYVLQGGSVMVAYGPRRIAIPRAQYRANGDRPALEELAAKAPVATKPRDQSKTASQGGCRGRDSGACRATRGSALRRVWRARPTRPRSQHRLRLRGIVLTGTIGRDAGAVSAMAVGLTVLREALAVDAELHSVDARLGGSGARRRPPGAGGFGQRLRCGARQPVGAKGEDLRLAAIGVAAGEPRRGAEFPGSQSRGAGEIDPEPVAPPLVAAGHLRRGVAELLLDVAFVDLGRRRQAGAQRVSGELLLPLALRKVAAHARGDRQALDQARDVTVVESFGSDLAPDDRPEHGPARDAGEFQPGLERSDRTGSLGRAGADLDLAPAGLAAQGQEHAVVEEFWPAGALERILRAHDEADDFRAAQAAGEAEEQDRPVAKIAQIGGGQGVEHGDHVLRQERLLLEGRPAVGAADAGEHGRDMAVLAVEGQGALGEIPGERREPPLDRGDRARPAARACRAGSERGEIEADAFGVGERPEVEAGVKRSCEKIPLLRRRMVHSPRCDPQVRIWLLFLPRFATWKCLSRANVYYCSIAAHPQRNIC